MSIVAKKVIKRLVDEGSELLKDAPREEPGEYDLSKINTDDMPPSELKRLTDAIARRRLTAPGLSKEETEALLRRIGH